MKRLFTSILAASFLVTVPAAAEFLKPPDPIPNERGAIVVTTTNGIPRWSADWTMEPWTDKGSPAVKFTENGKGHYSPFSEVVQWSVSAIWRADGAFKPLHFEKTFRNANNVVIETDIKDFDVDGKRSVQYVRSRPNSPPETKIIKVPPDTITVEGLAGVMRSIPFTDTKPFALHLFTNDLELWDMTIEARGREIVHTPAGDFDCYKVEMVPHLGVLDVLRKLFPKAHLWFTVAPPHFWVKYEGLENGTESPSIVMQLKRYEPAAHNGR